MTESRCKMAGSASEHPAFRPVGNHFRHRRMLVGKPVRWVRNIVNLILGVGFAAARDMLRAASVIDHGWNFVPYGKGPRDVRKLPLLSRLRPDPQNGKEREHQGANKNPGGNRNGSPYAAC